MFLFMTNRYSLNSFVVINKQCVPGTFLAQNLFRQRSLCLLFSGSRWTTLTLMAESTATAVRAALSRRRTEIQQLQVK